jgi:hypothetical protein
LFPRLEWFTEQAGSGFAEKSQDAPNGRSSGAQGPGAMDFERLFQRL